MKLENSIKATLRHSVRALLLTPDSRILLILSREPESGLAQWCPPGGGMEAEETVEESLRRELYEETGIRELPPFKHVWNRQVAFTWAGERIEQKETYYLIRTQWFKPSMQDNPEKAETDSFLKFRWWSIDSIKSSTELFIPKKLGQHLNNLFQEDMADYPIDVEV